MGGSSRVSCPVLGPPEGRKGGDGEQRKGNGSNSYIFYSGRKTEARDPESRERGPCWVRGSARRRHSGCGVWMHLGAGLMPWAPKILSERVTPAQEDPVPSGLVPGEGAACTCLNPASVTCGSGPPTKVGSRRRLRQGSRSSGSPPWQRQHQGAARRA